MAENRKQDTSVVEEIRTMQEVRDEWKLTRIRELPIDQISDFPAHPYKVKVDPDIGTYSNFNKYVKTKDLKPKKTPKA